MSQLDDLLPKFPGAAGGSVHLAEFAVQLISAAALAFVLSLIYGRFGRSQTNRRAFARNFVPITVTTMFVIAVVKSSLALSLGLVGALSIVRFRTAIREPEDLIYLFACIGVGLGMGAGQWPLTLCAFAIIAAVTMAANGLSGRSTGTLMHLLIAGSPVAGVNVESLSARIGKVCRRVALRRYEESTLGAEASFMVELASLEQVAGLRATLREMNAELRWTLVDVQGQQLD